MGLTQIDLGRHLLGICNASRHGKEDLLSEKEQLPPLSVVARLGIEY